MQKSFPGSGVFCFFHLCTKTSGVREGCILDRLLFNVYFNAVRDSDCNSSCIYKLRTLNSSVILVMLRSANCRIYILTLFKSGSGTRAGN